MTLHNRVRLPIGAVQTIEDIAGSMTFVAKVSRTRDGDEALELINDGVLTGVSVGAHVLVNRPLPDGSGVERMEARLEEISLAPMLFTQMPDAGVLAVRAVLANADGSDGVAGTSSSLATPTLDEARTILSKYARP
jgi:phage head maturation protease